MGRDNPDAVEDPMLEHHDAEPWAKRRKGQTADGPGAALSQVWDSMQLDRKAQDCLATVWAVDPQEAARLTHSLAKREGEQCIRNPCKA
jgi:hypothetical protein